MGGKELPFLTWQSTGYHVLLGNPPSLKESERFRKETKFSKPTCHSLIHTHSLGTWNSFEDLMQQCIAKVPEFIGTCVVVASVCIFALFLLHLYQFGSISSFLAEGCLQLLPQCLSPDPCFLHMWVWWKHANWSCHSFQCWLAGGGTYFDSQGSTSVLWLCVVVRKYTCQF